MSDDKLHPEDFRYTAALLRLYTAPETRCDFPGPEAMFRAVCSNNLNIILAALDAAAEREP